MSRIPGLPLEKIWRTRLWYRHRQCYDELYREGAEYEDIKGSCLRADCQGEEAEGPVKRRIMDMGITKGVDIYVRKVAPLGDPVEVTVRGYELSLRKADAEMIEVE